MPRRARCAKQHGRWADVMMDNRFGSPTLDERTALQEAEGCDDDAVVQASLDGALEDLVRTAVRVGSEPYAVSCARIDRAFNDRMAPHRHLAWARMLAEGLKMQLKLGLHRHVSSSGAAHEPHRFTIRRSGDDRSMTGEVVPLRSGQSATSALAHFDATATELLRQGRAATLTEARLDAIRVDLLAKRAGFNRLIADLRSRPPSGDARIDAVNTTLIAEVGKGLALIDMFIQHTDACAEAGAAT